MASGGAVAPVSEGGGSSVRASGLAAAGSSMDTRTMFLLLHSVTEDNIRFFREDGSEAGRRFAWAFAQIQEQGRGLRPLVGALAGAVSIFDLDDHTPANGYRSLLKVVRCCVLHLIHKARYVHSHRRSIFFRTNHNLLEVEAYCSALRQLRALTYFAQRLLASNKPGDLFLADERGLSEEFLREANSMHKGCFYGRCLGFQFNPSIRPFLQTISIGLVSFGENYRRHETGLGIAANSIFTSGKYAIDPELRGSEFERLTQNLDVHFWKAFWNITETEILASLVTLTSTTVQVNKTLSIPPDPFELPLLVDPTLTLVITPPVAHSGPGAVPMRLISYELRDGQDSDELNSFCKPQAQPSLDVRWKSKTAPRSRFLIVHFHGGGFVAHTSKSHEPYLKTWSQELESPILSVDYSLAPESPFPRALEECFFAYCWAVKNCHLLGSTGERICLAGDSAGGNLCITVSLRAASCGVRCPDGIMAAYPATLLQATASPSRLLTFIDPLLPLSVLSKCLSAYAGMEPAESLPSPPEKADPLCVVRNDPTVLLRDIRLGASAWFSSLLKPGKARQRTDTVRKSCSEAALGGEGSSRSSLDSDQDYVMSRTCLEPQGTSSPPSDRPSGPGFEVGLEEEEEGAMAKFPEGFQPLRSGAGRIRLQNPAIVRNPFMSPLLATDDMLRGMPPVHLVACALDPMLDDSVMFAKRLRSLRMPVSLCVVEDLPHGFLTLCQVSRETRDASRLCVERIRDVLQPRALSKAEKTGARESPADRDSGADASAGRTAVG